MQNGYFYEVEAAYRRHRMQEAAIASGLAAQATPRTMRHRPICSNLALAVRRAGEVLQQQWPVLRNLPNGSEIPAVQG